MMPGPTLIKQCPKCQETFKQYTLQSANGIGATYWSDGKVQAPSWPATPRLVKCPHCGYFVWLEEATIVETFPPERDDNEAIRSEEEFFERLRQLLAYLSKFEENRCRVDGVLLYEELTEQDYLAALRMPITDSPDKVRYLRIRAWWAANDRRRPNPFFGFFDEMKEQSIKTFKVQDGRWIECPNSAPLGFSFNRRKEAITLSADARANMESLFLDLSEANERERLLKAELARELGRFDEAKRLIVTEYSERNQHAVRRFLELVEERNDRVASLERPFG